MALISFLILFAGVSFIKFVPGTGGVYVYQLKMADGSDSFHDSFAGVSST